jgi:hypothetical protein
MNLRLFKTFKTSADTLVECVQRAAFKDILSEAAMINIHLYAYLLSPAETILKLQEAFEIIQINLHSLK